MREKKNINKQAEHSSESLQPSTVKPYSVTETERWLVSMLGQKPNDMLILKKDRNWTMGFIISIIIFFIILMNKILPACKQ